MSEENKDSGGGFWDEFGKAVSGVSGGVKELFGAYATIEQLKINSGMAKSQNNVAEWNAQAQLLNLQQQALFNRQQLAAQSSIFGGTSNGVMVIAALAAVAVGVYLVAK